MKCHINVASLRAAPLPVRKNSLPDARAPLAERTFRVDASTSGDFLCPHLEALQDVGAERRADGDVCRVPAARDQDPSDARRIVSSIEGVPAIVEVGLEPP